MKKPLLMVAEDDPDDQFLIQYAVEEACPADIEVFYAWDGFELLAKLADRIRQDLFPRLIVLDLNMPRKDGREVLQAIRTDSKLDSIPIAVLTTSNSTEDVHYCQDLGIVGYYIKPSSIAELQEIFGKLCTDYLQ